MTEKPIKVVIKLQMSPFCFPVFQHGRPNMLLSLTVREPLANTYIAIWYRTHFPIQFLPVASAKHSARSIFFNYTDRGNTFL